MDLIASFSDRTSTPWANGGGRTTELIALSESSALTPGLRPWRLSIAQLEVPGPFSTLPGLARTFLPIGAEVALEIDGRLQSVTPESPARFHGAQTVALVSLPEPCFALNLMVAAVGASGGDSSVPGPDSAGAAPALEMALEPADALFVVTLAADADHARFELLRLEPGEALPAALGAAYLG